MLCIYNLLRSWRWCLMHEKPEENWKGQHPASLAPIQMLQIVLNSKVQLKAFVFLFFVFFCRYANHQVYIQIYVDIAWPFISPSLYYSPYMTSWSVDDEAISSFICYIHHIQSLIIMNISRSLKCIRENVQRWQQDPFFFLSRINTLEFDT